MMLDSDIADLDSRLAFTINIDSLSGRKNKLDAGSGEHASPPRSKRRTLRKLIGSHKRLPRPPHAVPAVRPSADHPGAPLPLKLPSIADLSLNIVLWDGPAVALPESPPASCSDDDVVLASLIQPLTIADAAAPVTSDSAPRRERSLMFKPLLDVAAVGSLIDTISKPPQQPATSAQSASTADSNSNKGPTATVGGAGGAAAAHRRLLGSLRRTRAMQRPGTPRRQRSHYTTGMFHRSPGQQQQQSHAIRPIDTTQDDDAAGAGASAPAHLPLLCAAELPVEVPKPTVEPAAAAPPLPGLQAATAMLAQAPSTDDDAMPGYTPIAVSLKGSRSRQFLLHTPLGEFAVERTLGQGSYGKVKLMRSTLTNEQFAVKTIKRYPPHKHRRAHPEYRKAKTLDRRVVREANLAAILGQLHPHIVPLHDFRVTDTHFYLFYAFVDGVTLAERVGGGGLAEDEARAVFKPVAETINFCHQYSVIHRDIKLENVLIDYADEARSPWALVASDQSLPPVPVPPAAGAGAGAHRRRSRGRSSTSVPPDTPAEPGDFRGASVFDGRVKLIDFGLANFFDGTSLMDTFCGSLPYTAPEILRGDAYLGPEIDVWSLGVLLYVMHTGQFPFDDPAQPKNFEKIARGDFALHPSMSSALQDLLICMLEPAPARRISMHDVLRHAWLASASTPGACCLRHPQPTMGGIHDRRTLVLPGPRAHRLIAQEVAVCLGRSVDEVVHTIDRALASGTPLPPAEPPRPPRVQSRARTRAQSDPPPRTRPQQPPPAATTTAAAAEPWSLLAPLYQWPRELQDLGASGVLIEVPNSPFVSVYALVLQQIGMRRYYLELPATEPAAGGSGFRTGSSASLFAMPSSVPLAPHGLRALDGGGESTERSRTLATRLATQFASLASLTGQLVSAGGGRQGDTPAAPAYVQPLSMGKSMPMLPQRAPPGPSPADADTVPAVRTIVGDDGGTRIPLPTELAGMPPAEVLGLVSRLLEMHEIAHTYVETQRMPMNKALHSSMFSLKTVAALMETHQSALSTSPDIAEAPTSDDMLEVLSDGRPAAIAAHDHGPHGHLRALLHSMLPATGVPGGRLGRLFSADGTGAARRKGSLNPQLIVHPHLRPELSPPQQPPRQSTPPLHLRPSAPDIMTTIPVNHPTATILAQYSPSLNRWRETEVVEYYSCSVRIELVRLSPHRRHHPRYALLIDRMAGHKGKFNLFIIFLRRLAPVLPTLA
ncbi:Serine/threonine-protein kinase [Coemansia spiralis]|nr:Serine/threonine-protein kinase [Coemansia spiralis]